MKSGLSTLRFLVVGIGTMLFILGILFWGGRSLNLVPVHMILGGALVLCLWVLAGIGLKSGAPTGMTSLVILISLIMPILGIAQEGLLPGPWHWVIQGIHLIVGGAAIGLGQRLIRRLSAVQKRNAL